MVTSWQKAFLSNGEGFFVYVDCGTIYLYYCVQLQADTRAEGKQKFMNNERQRLQKHILALMMVMLVACLVIFIRYAWIQIVDGPEMAARMAAQVNHQYQLETPRGAITDRNGTELAVSSKMKSLFVDPNHVKDPAQLAADLAPLIDESEQDILDKIAEGGGFVWVKRRLPQDQYEAARDMIREKEYTDCLGFKTEAKRSYPNDTLAAQVLGFVGTEDKGLDGIEQSMDKLLKGEVTAKKLKTDQESKPIQESLFSSLQYQGDACKTVQLTIDAGVQFIVEQQLDAAMAANNPKAITCIVMDPQTGDVLAMASRPTYNPNHFWDYDAQRWKNRAVSFIYEPGSTFKSVVAGAALQEKIVTPNMTIFDPGFVMVSGHKIQNADNEALGPVTFADVVKHSLNTGFAQVGLRLGADKLTQYAKLFGFGEPTHIDLPGEEPGILFDPENMRDSDIATMSIGQSIAVTPLQLVTAISAIANDGILLQPHIIKAVYNADGSVYQENGRTEIRRTIESATDKTLMGLLEQVVSSGSGKKAAVKGYRIAGKTGTAQKIREDGAGYMDGHYIASFCGFAPVEKPQLVVLVMIDDPGAGDFYGGHVAAPVAGRIFSQLFRYLHIAPSSDPFAGMEKVQKDSKPAAKKSYTGSVPDGKVIVPDFQGMSLREAAQKASQVGLSFDSEGSGFGSRQSIAPNTLVDRDTEVTVWFQP